jgi:hypothetical protein
MRFRKKALWIVLVISSVVIVITTIQSGGDLTQGVRVKDFTLCSADSNNEQPVPLRSLILAPTTSVNACGYIAVKPSISTIVCLNFYLNKDLQTVYTDASNHCLPYRSQYFLIPITTTSLSDRGKYRLYVYDPGSRQWTESVAFEVK